ncbi:MAG TPA: helicase C-terminal domain-containing protein, partial [Dehalococcoidia bacterium]|nr:helicase C-terminal domain-containing protein [Dehalococcoidia bacterium]
ATVPLPFTTPARELQTWVALDLEMTGVDPETDAIIEIGAVRFSVRGEIETFSSLVNPGRALPYRIRALTGLSDEELQSAPPFEVVSGALREFLGASPIVGQRVGFDLLYLAREGLQPPGPVFNTAEIAELLMPGLPEYSLAALARQLGVEFPLQHRALADARAAMQVFLRLRERAGDIERPVLHEIVRLTAGVPWPLRFFFREIAADLPIPAPAESLAPVLDVVPPAAAGGGALVANAIRHSVTPEEIGEVFERVAADPAAFEGFEQRPEQLEMAQSVALAFETPSSLLVEAGTGTGKSLAYLLPAACHALRNNERVVISTNTISLQEQVLSKDVPAMRRVLERCGPEDVRERVDDLRAVALKGRANYLCLQKFATLRRQQALSLDEARFAVKLLLWLRATHSGDRAELRLRAEEEPLWNRLSAANADCFAVGSYYVRNGTCQLLRARKRAESAHLVVVNHALMLSDIANGGRVLPSYDRLIVDEAHNLEDEATNQFGFHTGQNELRAMLAAIADHSNERETGLAADVRVALRGEGENRERQQVIHSLLDTLGAAVEHARERLPELFSRLQAFVSAHAEAGGDYDNRLLITAGKRSQPEWQNVELGWENLRTALLAVQDGLGRLSTAIVDLSATGILDHEALAAQAQTQLQGLNQLVHGLDSVLLRHDDERIAWLTVNRQFGTVGLSSAPLNVGEVLESYLFGRKATVVLTSATLSAGGSFRYVRERLGLDEVDELALGSPFDYKRAALVLVPSDIPEPNRLDYQPALEQALVGLLRASEGRALVLFTSHGALRATYRAVRPALAADGIEVLGQGLDGAPKELLERLRNGHRTAIFGTASFWEGVDVVGDALSLLVIAKLPFSVPSDPVFAARSELFEDPFTEFALPQAVLRFKQGFGRLIRHRSDRGALVVLDRRVRSKRYGRTFIQSLPDCTVQDAALEEIPALV